MEFQKRHASDGEPGPLWHRENREIGHNITEVVEGDAYEATFQGTAQIASGPDEGTFLTDRGSRSEEERHFGIEHLFPYEWMDADIEYKITVSARKIEPPIA